MGPSSVDSDIVGQDFLTLRVRSSSPDKSILFLDTLGLLLVPIILGTTQFFAPDSFQTLLTFNSELNTPHGLFGHWAIHYSPGLMLENLLGYLLVVSLGYGLAWAIDERRWFRFSVLAIFLVIPFLSTIISTVAFTAINPDFSYTTRGASAAVAGLLGLLYVLYLGVLRRQFDSRAAISIGGAVLIFALSGLLAIVGSPSIHTLGTLAGAAFAVVILDGLARILRGGSHIPWTAVSVVILLGIAVTAMLTGYFIALFPADPFAGQTITNIFSHASGFGLGVIIAFWGHRYWTQWDWIGPSGPIL